MDKENAIRIAREVAEEIICLKCGSTFCHVCHVSEELEKRLREELEKDN